MGMGHVTTPWEQLPAILAIDPALDKTGLCYPDGTTYTSQGGKLGLADFRLNRLHNEVEQAVREWSVEVAILEDLPTHAHGAGLTGQAQGVVRRVLQKHKVPYVTVVASTLKKFATSSGKATKDDMWYALPLDVQSTIPQSATDETDAYHLWTMGVAFWRKEEVPSVVKWGPWEKWSEKR